MLNESAIIALVSSNNDFPVAINDAWQWLGYSTKQNAITAFSECGMAETLDFTVLMVNHKHAGSFSGYQQRQEIFMTVDAFKSWAMMARTERGREVRKYFLQVERAYREQLAQQQASAQKALPPFWRENRYSLADIEPSYQRWCDANGFSPSHTTNYIYEKVLGMRAKRLRELPLVLGQAEVACNHIPTADELNIICNTKLQLTKFSRVFQSYKQAVESALASL